MKLKKYYFMRKCMHNLVDEKVLILTMYHYFIYLRAIVYFQGQITFNSLDSMFDICFYCYNIYYEHKKINADERVANR